MASFTLKADDQTVAKIISSFDPEYVTLNKTDTIKAQIRYDECIISIYNTNTVLFQGKNANIYYASFAPEKDIIFPQAGSDEVGTGSYFGPITVCATYIDEAVYEKIKDYNLIDSKQIDDSYILQITPELIRNVPHSLLVLENEKYNEVNQKYNMNQIKAMMHNQCFIHLKHRGYRLPALTVIDQFCAPELYYRYNRGQKEVFDSIIFHTKAENQFISVACGAIISRYSFLKKLDELSETYGMKLPSGAGKEVDEAGKAFAEKYGFESLRKVAKLNFKNTEKIRELL
ncbi:MAG: ribonuclease HIII [Erysipelotrichaceae bacterium]|nr:ribonuclease HIII [Erysipelotrichaceae bacterium]